jgi:hypothetical protein
VGSHVRGYPLREMSDLIKSNYLHLQWLISHVFSALGSLEELSATSRGPAIPSCLPRQRHPRRPLPFRRRAERARTMTASPGIC